MLLLQLLGLLLLLKEDGPFDRVTDEFLRRGNADLRPSVEMIGERSGDVVRESGDGRQRRHHARGRESVFKTVYVSVRS